MATDSIRSKIVKAWLWPIARLLKTGDNHVTIDRLFVSKHVRDLQLIIAVSCIAVFLLGCVGAAVSISEVLGGTWRLYDAAVRLLKYGGPVLLVFGGVVSWAYNVGSARLGVVDLFSCEINALCRVTKLIETAHQCIYKVDHPPSGHSTDGKLQVHGIQQFTSQEDYFPVFGANSQALQTLEAAVVVNITAFYTYMKAFRDSLRALAQIGHASSEMNDQRALEVWRSAASNSVYVLFLGLESARLAISDLVEFEPEQAEYMIVILLSELEAFQFLRRKYSAGDDIYSRRIELRVPKYEKVVPELSTLVNRQSEEAGWKPAWLLLDELESRYKSAVSEFENERPHEQGVGAQA